MRALAVDLGQVATTARGWDEQSLCLRAAHDALSVSPAGFTARVQADAHAFLAAWLPVTRQLSVACESHADGLRSAAREIVATDGVIADDVDAWLTGVLLREER